MDSGWEGPAQEERHGNALSSSAGGYAWGREIWRGLLHGVSEWDMTEHTQPSHPAGRAG